MELVQSPVAELKSLLTQSFEECVSADVRRAGVQGATFACALSGGATGLIFLPALRVAQVNWSTITLFWADERAVDPDDPESNYGLADRMLLTPLGRKAPRAFRAPVDTGTLTEAAALYDATLARELGLRPLDLAILGVGDDGHVASLFLDTLRLKPHRLLRTAFRSGRAKPSESSQSRMRRSIQGAGCR